MILSGLPSSGSFSPFLLDDLICNLHLVPVFSADAGSSVSLHYRCVQLSYEILQFVPHQRMLSFLKCHHDIFLNLTECFSRMKHLENVPTFCVQLRPDASISISTACLPLSVGAASAPVPRSTSIITAAFITDTSAALLSMVVTEQLKSKLLKKRRAIITNGEFL